MEERLWRVMGSRCGDGLHSSGEVTDRRRVIVGVEWGGRAGAHKPTQEKGNVRQGRNKVEAKTFQQCRIRIRPFSVPVK